jgi:hypothetical protein
VTSCATGGAARALVVGALLLAVAACGTGGTAAATSSSASSVSPGPARLAVDPFLLELLPRAVDGIPLDLAPEAAAEIAMDAALGRSGSAVAVALAVAPRGTSGSDDPSPPDAGPSRDPTGSGVVPPDDLAIVTLVRLLPGTFSEDFFRDWRDSHDAAACAPAGGIGGHAEGMLGGRRTFITTCRGGPRVHHAHLVEPDVLVAVTSLGDRRLGERLVATIPADGAPRTSGSGGGAASTMAP